MSPLIRPASACGALLALFLGQPSAAQELRAYDGMDYTGLQTIHNQNGGAGWATPWVGVGSNSLLSWWPMDGSAGDAGPLGANATLTNGTFGFDTPANLIWSNQSLKFSSSPRTLYDLSAYSDSIGRLMRGTITAWVKPDITGALMVIFGAANDNKQNLQLFIQNKKLNFEVKGGLPTGSKISGGTEIADGTWHHVAVSVDDAGFTKIYVDGAVETSGPSGFFGHVLDVTGVWLGRTKTTIFTRFYKGDMDDVALWGNVLTEAEIQSLASLPPPLVLGSPQPTGPLVAPQSLGGSTFPSGAFNTFRFSPVGNRVSDNNGISAHRKLKTKNRIDLSKQNTHYISCLMTRSGASISDCEIHFSYGGGTRCRFGWNGGGFWEVGVDKTTLGPWVQPNIAYFTVFKIVSVPGTAGDQVFLQVYAPGETVTAAEPTTYTVESALEPFNEVLDVMWLKQFGNQSIMEVDEIRIGSTWEAVTSLGYGAGCLGNVIDKLNRPAIGSTDYEVHLDGAEASVAAFLSLGVSRSMWGITQLPLDLGLIGATGCSVLASREATVPTTTNSNGFASQRLPIPNIPSLVDQTIFTQWASLAPNSPNAFKLAFSDAMEILIEN